MNFTHRATASAICSRVKLFAAIRYAHMSPTEQRGKCGPQWRMAGVINYPFFALVFLCRVIWINVRFSLFSRVVEVKNCLIITLNNCSCNAKPKLRQFVNKYPRFSWGCVGSFCIQLHRPWTGCLFWWKGCQVSKLILFKAVHNFNFPEYTALQNIFRCVAGRGLQGNFQAPGNLIIF